MRKPILLLSLITLLTACSEEEKLPPAKPELESPSDNSTGAELDLIFSWSEVEEANSYNFQLSTHQDFTNIDTNLSQLSTESTQIEDLKPSTIYYWRVNAKNATGISPWSTTNKFTTKSLAVPTLIAPIDNSIQTINNIEFSWNTVIDAPSYNLQISTTSDFTGLIINKTNLTSASIALSGFMYSTSYYWRISSTRNNSSSEWSATRKFTTDALGIPDLVLPENDSKPLSKNITFEWGAVTGASGYNLEVSNSADFSSLVVNKANLSSLTFSTSNFKWNTKYYWRVNAMVANCQSEWSTIRNFTTSLPVEGLVAWYPFNGNANDESGNNNHGVISGSTLTSDRYGALNMAYYFDGVNDFINVINPTILNFANDISFTVSFFYKPETVVSNSSGFNGIISRFHNNIGPASGWQIGRDNTHLSFQATNPCGNNNLTSLTINNWIHVLQIYDRTNGIIKTYINSTLVNSTNCSSIISSMVNNYDLKIGVEREGNQFSSGKIDDIRIYNRMLLQEEIIALFNE